MWPGVIKGTLGFLGRKRFAAEHVDHELKKEETMKTLQFVSLVMLAILFGVAIAWGLANIETETIASFIQSPSLSSAASSFR
jgi:hypothetical protein